MPIENNDPNDGNNSQENIKENFEQTYTDSTISKANVYSMNEYLFSTSNFGWINCDRFLDRTKKRINYAIALKTKEDCIVNMVFHRFKSILMGVPANNTFHFYNIPTGEKVTLVAIKFVDKKPFLSIQTSETSNKADESLVFQAVTMELLKAKMEELNKL
jgi:hypothetical protein